MLVLILLFSKTNAIMVMYNVCRNICSFILLWYRYTLTFLTNVGTFHIYIIYMLVLTLKCPKNAPGNELPVIVNPFVFRSPMPMFDEPEIHGDAAEGKVLQHIFLHVW